MRSLSNLIRMQKWKLDEQRRVVGDLEELIGNYQAQLQALEDEFASEKALAAENPDVGMMFSQYAEAARLRKGNLTATIEELQEKLSDERDIMAELFQELKKYEISEETRIRRLKEAEDKRQQEEMDAFSLEIFRRNQN